ncbi:hypothetical protein DPMN_114424 [Dreissena polymorpha]|uniref:Uncharacterized protein n=1 Tax=Dreissena polymorpha TaxID=45954 RepID=A0A9D4KJV4_DREPO|nr:hypothetical protein DPMN_114424 [Dreissena polymorpha]
MGCGTSKTAEETCKAKQPRGKTIARKLSITQTSHIEITCVQLTPDADSDMNPKLGFKRLSVGGGT